MVDWSKIKVGDTIKVKTYHFRVGRRTATRKVVAVDTFGVGIKMFGWNPFYLTKRQDQIIEHIKSEDGN